MAGLYPNIDVYTAQLRKLEAFVSANPTSTAGRFVLAYHYLTQGHIDAAVAQLKQVVALAPQDTLSAQLVKQFSKPGTEPDTPPAAPAPAAATTPAKPGNLAGNWTARPTNDTTIRPGRRGRRDLHLDGRLQGQAAAARGEVVARRRPAHARPVGTRRGPGRPRRLAGRRPVELPRDRDRGRRPGAYLPALTLEHTSRHVCSRTCLKYAFESRTSDLGLL